MIRKTVTVEIEVVDEDALDSVIHGIEQDGPAYFQVRGYGVGVLRVES